MKSIFQNLALSFASMIFAGAAMAQAQTPTVANRAIEETYESPWAPSINSVPGALEYVQETLPDSTCYRAAKVPVDVSFTGFGSYRLRDEIPAEKPYFSRDFSFRSDSEKCTWNHNEILKQITERNKGWQQISHALRLTSMNTQLSAIEGRAVYEGELVAKYISGTGRKRAEFPFTATLKECQQSNGEEIEAHHLYRTFAPSTDLLTMLASLRDATRLRIVRCTFRVKVAPLVGDISKNEKVRFSDGMSLNAVEGDDRLHLTNTNINHEPMSFNRTGAARDNHAESLALRAVERLTTFLAEEYGDLLYSLSSAKKTDAEKEEIIRGFFARNGQRIKDEFKLIDDNYAHVSLMNKISILINLNRTYNAIRAIESRVARSNVTLDRIVQLPVR